MDFFQYLGEKRLKKESPLAYKLRPKRLEEIVGQEHILGEGKPLYNLIKNDKLTSIILYGPPGTGKTTIAHVIAQVTNNIFKSINATIAGINDIKKIIEEAKLEFSQGGRRTILFIDEIHRFNKLQQDALLPSVEEGIIVLIGATTENPFYEVNKALVSRSLVFELFPLKEEDIIKIINRAISDKENGLGEMNIKVEENAKRLIARLSNGDARVALNILEACVYSTKPLEDGTIMITQDTVGNLSNRKISLYDATGDMHYDTISAFIKSVRGSDPDAALFYLAKMLDSGEDIKFIARRLIILAAEDIGLADPMALNVATSAAWACEFVGMPEARIILSEATIYLACAPKSNSAYLAIEKALEDAKNTPIKSIPMHLRMASHGEEKLGHGIGYLYPHDFKNHWVKQQYLPDELVGRRYYYPSEMGKEREIKEYIENLKKEDSNKSS
ncbi:AAA ATPase, central domain protein [Caldicellulosiruptor saccharolyticus DSM 8903]|uniref:Replication-associated recombination protein A n=1 Tax=Caldicellulosiruptor saccharolyticus (strain ATCC 43494 / DSM 8903 / Tp8T 6331) TaxID=351627 RepID=A4XL60_CALS8|nr:replication-associated recombination protein A [Caldicellulosiruptor saccharolyticus]ABP67645.1 AAA ATPase, central domain protein [Caldicellulosiruptor saccharolyticus DSM 8903]